ncbi:uncharacterized protein G9a isoform X3 [Procambarus clarkii]|uniref:uncharacterized protein G9a isoform X3 n=1 Tax=Procambarus clarkii TaxID=6728 RepID=UPI003743B3CE
MNSQELQGKGSPIGNFGKTVGGSQQSDGSHRGRNRGKKGKAKARWIEENALLHGKGSGKGGNKIGKKGTKGLGALSGGKKDLSALSGGKKGLSALSGGKKRLGTLPGGKKGLGALTDIKKGLEAISVVKKGLGAHTGDKKGLSALSGGKKGLSALSGDKKGLSALTGDKKESSAFSCRKKGLGAHTDGKKIKKSFQLEIKSPDYHNISDNIPLEEYYTFHEDDQTEKSDNTEKVNDSSSVQRASDIPLKAGMNKTFIMDFVAQNGEEKNKLLEAMSRQFNSANIPEGSVPPDVKRSTRVPRLTRKRKSEVLDNVEKMPEVPVTQQISNPSLPVHTIHPITSALKKVRKDNVEILVNSSPNVTPTVTPNTTPNATPTSGRKRRKIQEKKLGEKDPGEETTSTPEAQEIDPKTEESSSNEKGVHSSRGKKRVRGRGKPLVEFGEGNDSGNESLGTSPKGRGKARSSSEEDSLSLAELIAPSAHSRGRGKGKSTPESATSTPVARGRGKGKGLVKDDSSSDGKGRVKQKLEGEKMDESLTTTLTPGSGRGRGKGKVSSEEGGNFGPGGFSPGSSPSGFLGKRGRGKVEVDKEETLEVEAANRQRRSMTPVAGETTQQSEPKRSQRLSLSRDGSHDGKKGKQKTISEIQKKQEYMTIKGYASKGKKDDESLFTKTGKKKKKHFKGLSYSFSRKRKKGKGKGGYGKSGFDNSQETDSVVSEEIDAESIDSSSQDVPSEQLSYQDHNGMDDGLSEAPENDDIEMDNVETLDGEGEEEQMEELKLEEILVNPVQDKVIMDIVESVDSVPANKELSNTHTLKEQTTEAAVEKTKVSVWDSEHHGSTINDSERYEAATDTQKGTSDIGDEKTTVQFAVIEKPAVPAICLGFTEQKSDTEEDIESKNSINNVASEETITTSNENNSFEKDCNAELLKKDRITELTEKDHIAQTIEKDHSIQLAEKECNAELIGKDCFAELTDKDDNVELVEKDREAELVEKDREAELAEKDCDTELVEKDCDAELAEKDCDAELVEKDRDAELAEKDRDAELVEKDRDTELTKKDCYAKLTKKDLKAELTEKDCIAEVTEKAIKAELIQDASASEDLESCDAVDTVQIQGEIVNVNETIEDLKSVSSSKTKLIEEITTAKIQDKPAEEIHVCTSQFPSNVLGSTDGSVLDHSATPGAEDMLPEEGATLAVEEKINENPSVQQSLDSQLASVENADVPCDEIESATIPPSYDVKSNTGVNSSQEDTCKTNLISLDNREPLPSNDQSLRHLGKRRHSVTKRRLDDLGVEGHNSDSSDSLSEARPVGEAVRKSKRLSRNSSPHPLAIVVPRSPEAAGTGQNQPKPIGTQSALVATPSLTNVLCRCRVREDPTAVGITGDVYCQAVDSFDGRMIGCCNIVTSHKYLRVSGKIPFMLLCEVHRHRLRRHNCCPCCGLFCTQGVFYECSWDKSGLRHYYHKLCGLMLAGATLCPHCGAEEPPKEVQLELKLNRKPVVYLKQHQERKEASARMTWSKKIIPETVAITESLPENEPSIELRNGRVISAHKLPLELGREKLQDAIRSIIDGKSVAAKPSPKGVYWSCKQNDLEKLLHVLVHGVSPNVKVKEYGNQTGMHVAAAYGSLAAMHVLTLAGATIDMTDTQLMTPLMVAITKEQNSIVHYLIQAGASLMAKTQDGMTCLHLAAKCGNLIGCQHILDSGRLTRHAVNMQDEGGWTPLVWASENKFTSVVKFLLDRGGNPQLCDVEQNTALHWAAFSGSTHICSMVLDRGCSLRSMNAHGDTPLHIAARQNHIDAVVLLLSRGARLDVLNTKGQTPIDCALPESDVYLQLTLNSKLIEMMNQNNIRTEKILSSDIAAGKEEVPIPCVNGVDDDELPKDYLYIAENCEASNVIIDRTITSMKWCECEDGCNADHCGCGQLNFQCWYDPDGRLLPEFNYADPPMIFECNRACRCNKLSCNNRVVQHGISAHMQLFKTSEKGWGVRALKTIQKGSYVCEYVGEIITDLEADQRQDDSYLFDLDNKDSETFCIDARGYGNIARFINHLCEANLTPVKVFIDHQDLTFPRIAFFANRDIEADEELGFDYGEKFWIIKYKHFTCTCTSEKCKYSCTTIHTTLENYNKRIREMHEMISIMENEQYCTPANDVQQSLHSID